MEENTRFHLLDKTVTFTPSCIKSEEAIFLQISSGKLLSLSMLSYFLKFLVTGILLKKDKTTVSFYYEVRLNIKYLKYLITSLHWFGSTKCVYDVSIEERKQSRTYKEHQVLVLKAVKLMNLTWRHNAYPDPKSYFQTCNKNLYCTLSQRRTTFEQNQKLKSFFHLPRRW